MADFSNLTDCSTRLGVATDADQQLLRAYMGVATGMMTDFLNRDPRLTDYDSEVCHGQGTGVLVPYHYPITEVQSLTIAGTLADPSTYTFDRFAIYLNGGTFPRGRANIQVSYSAGEDPLPRQFREAHMIAVTGLWIARDQNPNATGESWAGVSSEQWQPEGPGYLPRAARMMIQSFKHPGRVN